MSKILITSALPYANGPIHFGHVAGAYLPADIHVRYRRAKGDEVLYICGSDEHGAPITANAKKAGQSPEQFTLHWHNEIKKTFDFMGIEFDNFSRTSLPQHHARSQEFFRQCQAKGYLSEKVEKQPFCKTCQMFLPDRYLVGTCPQSECGHEKARGDECPKCGHWIEAGTLINPRCKDCGSTPEVRQTRHWYLELGKLQPKLEEWLGPKRSFWKSNVLSQVDSWLKQGLRARAITRDLDWGVKVPVEGADGKVLYVWFDAPIGYISSTQEWAERQGKPEAWKDWWCDPEVLLLHFIGKDNIVFHCLTWPAMLMCQDQGYNLPNNVPANEFLNLEGDKFSSSEGWYIDLEDFFSKYHTDAVRYAIARIAPETSDSDWRWEDFQAKVNAELNDAYGNLAQRCLKFLHQHFGGVLPEPGEIRERDQEELEVLATWPSRVGSLLDRYKVREGAHEFMELARRANRYFNEKQPWKTRKTDEADARTTFHVTCRILATLAVLGRPFMPKVSAKLWGQLGLVEEELARVAWDDAAKVKLPVGQPLGEVAPLFEKISDKQIQAEIQALQERKAAMCRKSAEEAEVELEPFTETMTFDDFLKVDIRVGQVLEAEEIKKSKKLLKLQIDVGVDTRQILAGIKQFYSPEDLVGRKVAVVVNLAPRKMMGQESQGMVVATTDAATGDAVLVDPGQKTTPGSRLS
jgi:methionyl-tRNA synthetase